MKYGQNNVKMYVTSFSCKFYGHTFISFMVISVRQKKETEVNKKKNKVMTQLLEACVSLPISSASLVTIFHLIFFSKNIHISFFQKQILMTDLKK